MNQNTRHRKTLMLFPASKWKAARLSLSILRVSERAPEIAQEFHQFGFYVLDQLSQDLFMPWVDVFLENYNLLRFFTGEMRIFVFL